ncbi:MAG: hypothetical protein ONB37_20145, partial [candidate division KSB1 bacterium]|nr:hypothetical protein [candidate division KSB1 bacterium]
MSSQTAVESRKRGLLEKIEKMNGFFGGWQSLLRGRTARNKRLKKERKLARESRLGSFGREFRGRLMLEPLEERIVPASVVLIDGQAALFDGPGGSILVVAVAGNSALDGIEIDYTQNAGADTINEIGLIGDGTGGEIINAQIFTNFGKTEAGGTLIFNDVDAGGGSTSTVARTAPDADTWNVTIATGQAFTDGGVNIINIGTKSFSFAGRDFRDTTGDTGAIAAIGSDVDAIDMDASAATVNFVNATVGGNLFYAVQIPAAGSADKGDLDIFTIDGELGTSSTIYLEGIGSIFLDLNVTDADGTGNFDVNTTGNDYGKITINDFGEATHRVDLDVSDYSLGGIINIISTGSLGTFGTLGTITTRALSGSSDPVDTYIDIVGTVGSITTINAGTVENDLKMVDIDDAVGTVLNVGGRITGIMDADDDADGSGSFGNITVTNAAGLADGITAGGITAGNGIGNIIVTGDIDSTAPIITATGNIGNITVTGDIDAAITATAGSIGSVQASSDITGALTAGTSIGNITATTGNITGAIVAGSSIGNITAGTAITSPAITAGTGSIGSILAQAGSITSAITAGGTIGTITATGAASDITGNIIAANGIGAISAGQDITSGTINGNSDGDTNGTGIASITAGRDINVTTITTDDGADVAPTGPSIGDITAGGDITITNLISGGDLSNITAGGSDGDITIVKAEADGDIDVVTTTGTGTLTGFFVAYAATASSPIASFIDAGTGTVYTIDVTGPFTSAAIYFGIGLGFGATPDVGMMNVTGTTSATDLYIYTASVATPTDPSSSSALVDLNGIDVDDSNNFFAGPPFFHPFPWAFPGPGANNDGNVTPEKEANLGTLTVDGWLGISDGFSSGPGYIDFDTGAAANNLGDISSMFFEGGVIPLSVVEAESLGAFGLEGNLANLPNFSLVEVTVTEALNVVITAPAGSTAGYFFTTDVTKPFGEAIYVTAHATQAATATIDYIDGNDDGVVLGNNVGGAGDGFIVGNVQLPAWGFESTVGVASITETGENPAPGVPIIGFIEVAGPLGTVTVTDSNTANGIPADVWSISVGFNIGIPGVDDSVVPEDFLEANATDDVAGNNNGVWMANSSANLTSVQIDGDLGNATDGTDVALAVTGSVGVAGSNAIRLRSFGTAGNSDLAGDVLIGDDLLGHVIVDGEIDNDGLNDIFAVGVAKKGETVVGTWN